MTVRSETAENGTTKLYQQTFDAENRLFAVTVGSTNFTFAYNAMGGRVASVKDSADGKTVTLNPFPFFEVALETETSPTAVTQQSSAQTSPIAAIVLIGLVSVLLLTWLGRQRVRTLRGMSVWFVLCAMGLTFGLAPQSQAEPVQISRVHDRLNYLFNGQVIAVRERTFGNRDWVADEKVVYLHSDHLGSATAMSDEAGLLINDSITKFDAFGNYRAGSEPARTPGTATTGTEIGYTGHRQNDAIKLTYMNARFYVPEIGRFASADSIIPDHTNPQTLNRYSYVYNNPINMIDPSGHNGCSLGYLDCDIGTSTDAERSLAVTVGSMMPYVDTSDDLVTFFTGCSLLCQAGYEDPVGWGWRAVAGVGIVLPVGYRSVKTFSNGIGNGIEAIGKIIRRCPNSFSAETLVQTEDGTFPISEIRVGDMVLAYNEETGEVGYYPVTDLIRHIDPVIVLLTIDGEVIETTPEHPFYEVLEWMAWEQVGVIQPGLWTDAEDLQVGDKR